VHADVEVIERALDVARSLGRGDLEATATEELAAAALAMGDVSTAWDLAERAKTLAVAAGRSSVLGWALLVQARVHGMRAEETEAADVLAEAHEHFAGASVVWGLARVLNERGVAARRVSSLSAAERHYRDAIRLLAPTEDRGTLCESQRGLAEVLVELGRVDEAEKHALDAVATVGAHDIASRATTCAALGVVRAAQARDEEAESHLRQALELISETDLRCVQVSVIEALTRFLRSRGREEEAVAYEAELAVLLPATA
jgi:tetratricopeptide (TPR) repeat protein